MNTICKYLGFSKSGYYKKLNALPQKKAFEQKVVSTVKEIRKDKCFYGLRKVHKEIERGGLDIGRDCLWRIMQQHGLMLQLKRNKFRTTIPGESPKDSYNLIEDLEITAPNQVWLTDITYLNTADGVLYLSTIMDLFSRKIISHSISTDLTTNSSLICLKQALKSVTSAKGIIHHSDRGCQYCSHLYRHVLKNNGLIASYTGRNHCYENAKMERFFNTLKYEYRLKEVIKSKEMAKFLVKKAIDDYNNSRIHAALGYKTPGQIYQAA